LEHATETPSYTGKQFFYNPYVNAFDYQITLVPEILGAGTGQLKDTLYGRFKRDVTTYIKEKYVSNDAAQQAARTFAEANMYPFTADELIERVFKLPNWEYYRLLSSAADDRVALQAAMEIMQVHPGLVLRYSARNFYHFIFDPGFAHTRYNLNGFTAIGLRFYPADGQIADGEAEGLPARVLREAKFVPLTKQPAIVSRVFNMVAMVWSNEYRNFVRIVGVLMCIAWAAAIVSIVTGLKTYFRRRPKGPFTFPDKFAGCVLVASALLIYNAAVTAVFAEPDFRYRHMVDLQALLIAGLGCIAIQHWLLFTRKGKFSVRHASYFRQCARAIDVFSGLTLAQLIVFVGFLIAAIYLSWILFMLHHTG
jgi:hypothetical protein